MIIARKTLVTAAIALSSVFVAAAQVPVRESDPRLCDKALKPSKDSSRYNLQDLTAHPFAGTVVGIYAANKDGLGQTAVTDKIYCRLPEREWRNPLTRALAVFRRNLAEAYQAPPAEAQGKARRIAASLSVFIRDNEKNFPEPALAAGLKVVQGRLAVSQKPDVADQAVNDLWKIMLQMEEESLTKAERALRDAEKALREAIEKGASPEEIRKRLEEAIKAMQEAMKEMAARAQDDENARRDFENMEKRLEEMRKLMEQLEKLNPDTPGKIQKMMQQTQKMMQQQGEQSQQSRQTMQQMMQAAMERMQQQQQAQQMQNDLQKIIKGQQGLMDETSVEASKNAQAMEAVRGSLEDSIKKTVQAAEEKRQEAAQESARRYDGIRKRGEALSAELDQQGLSEVEKQMILNAKGEEWAYEEEKGPVSKRQSEMAGLKSELEALQNSIRRQREDRKPMTESEADDILKKLQDADKKIQGDGKISDNVPPPGEPSPERKNNAHEQIREMMNSGKGNEDKTSALSQQQQGLRGQLEQFIRQIQRKGLEPKKLGDAGENMGQADGHLQNRQTGDAVSRQNEALQNLREGAQQLQEQLQRARKQLMSPEDGKDKSPDGRQTDPDDEDIDDILSGKHRPDAGLSPAEVNRARALRDEIRSMISDPKTSPARRRWLEGLLEGKSGSPAPR